VTAGRAPPGSVILRVYRQKIGNLGETLRPVEIVRLGPKLSNKVRGRWLDGEFEGLDEWIPTVRLLVPWEVAEAFHADVSDSSLLTRRSHNESTM
jgi:hypothetical protein